MPADALPPCALPPSIAGALSTLFSARLVVVPDPALGLDQCGLPRSAARSALGLPPRSGAGELAERARLRPVLVTREDSLDQSGVQAFFPSIIDADALTLSPRALLGMGLAPGDQVGVHALLTEQAREEACQRMMYPATALRTQDGLFRFSLPAEALLGLAHLSWIVEGERGQTPLPEAPCDPFPDGLGLSGRVEVRYGVTELDSWKRLLAGVLAGSEPAACAEHERQVALLRRWQLARFGHLRGFHASLDEVRRAFEAGELALRARVLVRRGRAYDSTSLGRLLIVEALGGAPRQPMFGCVNERFLKRELLGVGERQGVEALGRALSRLTALGLDHATRAGLSLCADSFPEPPKKPALVREAFTRVKKIVDEYQEGLITDGERFNKIVDTWADAADRVQSEMMEHITPAACQELQTEHIAWLMSASGAAGSPLHLRKICSMRGLMGKPSGDIIETPSLSNLRRGLGSIEAFTTSIGTRRGRLNEQKAGREARSILGILAQALGEIRVVERDCGTPGAMLVSAVDDGSPGLVMASLSERVAGRVLGDVVHFGDQLLEESKVPEGSVLQGEWLEEVLNWGVKAVPIRSLVTCEAEGGVCAVCHGKGPGLRGWPEVGAAVGMQTAQAIASASIELVRRTLFFACGCAGCGNLSGGDEEVTLVAGGAGIARWCDLLWGVSYDQKLDEVTGLEVRIVRLDGPASLWPRIEIEGAGGERWVHELQDGMHLRVGDGVRVASGDELAWLPGWRTGHMFADVAMGRQSLISLLSARVPKHASVLSEIKGDVTFEPRGPRVRTSSWGSERAVVVTPRDAEGVSRPDLARRHPVPKGRFIPLVEGDRVRAGDTIVDGDTDPQQVLRVFGLAWTAQFLVDQMLHLFALSGVVLAPQHAELVVRELLGFVRVVDPGDGERAAGSLVRRAAWVRESAGRWARGERAGEAEPALVGLPRARSLRGVAP